MPRDDGRLMHDVRPIDVHYERLNRVDGSARFGFGQTQSVVSISGPIEARPASESPSQATLDIHVRPLGSVPGTDAKALAAVLKTVFTPALILSQHPRTLVQIVGQALCGNETGSGMGSVGRGWNASLVATLINATTAALFSAGSVPIKGVVCAVAVGKFTPSGGDTADLLLDPSEPELTSLTGSGCFAFLFSSALPTGTSVALDEELPNYSLIWTNYTSSGSSFSEAEFLKAQGLAQQGAVHVWRRLKESVADLDSNISTPILQLKGKTEQQESGLDDVKMEI